VSTEWIDCLKAPPKTDITAIVCSEKGWMRHEKAVYIPKYGVWLDHETRRFVLEVTHYIPLPEPPEKKATCVKTKHLQNLNE